MIRHATYFSRFPDAYATSDEPVVDADGQIWVLGRAGDVINVAAHRISTMEIEGAAASTPGVAEAAEERAIGGIARLRHVYVVTALPKTRAGKVMRRLLREAAETGAVRGDLTGLDDPAALEFVLDAVGGR